MRAKLISVIVLAAFVVSCAARPGSEATAAWASEPGGPIVLAATVEQQPATQPAADEQPAQSMPALPKGHPDISSMMGGGTGANGANGAAGAGNMAGQLPAGHPDIAALMGNSSANPNAMTTSLTIQAVQATIGGPAVGTLDATVQIFDRDRPVKKLETKLNEKGEATVTGVPVGPTLQPLVTVIYAGVEYQAAGQPISAAPQTVAVKVYETTDQPVGWDVHMRHMMLQPTADGVQVIDMLAIDNATDRAYVGPSDGSADGKRVSFELPLPAGATDVKLIEGFHDCCSKLENGKVVNTMAIVPGRTQFQLMYFIPQTDGKAVLTVAAPALTKHFIIFAPEDGTSITATGLESGTSKMGNGVTRYFKANAVPADQAVKLEISGTPTRAAAGAAGKGASPGAAMAGNMDSAQIAKTVAGIGGLLIFLIGGAMFFRRPNSNLAKKQAKTV